MDYSKFDNYTLSDLKKLASTMELPLRRSRIEMLAEIKNAFTEYEDYKKSKIDKYKKYGRLGNKGKEGITYLVKTKNGKEYAMKTFRKKKSSDTLVKEYKFQKRAAARGISPYVVENDTVSKYIVMEKMDSHLFEYIEKQKGHLTRTQQKRIIEIFTTLDECRIFHGDANMTNYMIKDKQIYIIDFGFAKEINTKFIQHLGTDKPNMHIMLLGFILKLKEMKCNPSSYKYLITYLSNTQKKQFNI